MKKQEVNSLDKLFSSLNETRNEIPSAVFLHDLEQRLDAHKKRRKPVVFWWFFSVFGAILISVLAFNWKNSDAETQTLSAQKSHTRIQSKLASSSNSQSSIPTSSSTISSSKSSSSPSTSGRSLFSNATSSKTSTPRLTETSHSFSSAQFKEIQSSYIADTYAISASSAAFSTPQSISSANATNTNLTDVPHVIEIMDTNVTVKAPQASAIPPVKVISLAAPTPRNSKHMIGLQFGVSGIFSSFEVPAQYNAISSYDEFKFRTERQLAERQTSSWDINLRYQYQFGKWGLQTGLNYLEWGEQFKYAVISVEGTNRYQYVQIPLGMFYQIPIKKIVLQPTLGISYGYGLQTSGTYILPANNGVAQVNAKQFSGNLWAQLELVYPLNEQISVSVAPIYRKTFGNLVNNGLIINKYQSVGLLTGLSYRF